MALNDAALNIAADAMGAVITHIAIHTAEPDAAGSNESTAARQAVTWNAAAAGDIAIAAAEGFTGGAPSGPATHVGFWSALTVGTFYGWVPITGDQTFNAAGEFSINTLTLNGSAS
jgi:hypothetical protein